MTNTSQSAENDSLWRVLRWLTVNKFAHRADTEGKELLVEARFLADPERVRILTLSFRTSLWNRSKPKSVSVGTAHVCHHADLSLRASMLLLVIAKPILAVQFVLDELIISCENLMTWRHIFFLS